MIPSIGRMVHFVLSSGPNYGKHRPAIITNVWEEPATEKTPVSLTVFPDALRDELPAVISLPCTVSQDNHYKMQGTWHEPERG